MCVDVGMHDQVDETAALVVQGVDLAAFDVEHPTVQAQLLLVQRQATEGRVRRLLSWSMTFWRTRSSTLACSES